MKKDRKGIKLISIILSIIMCFFAGAGCDFNLSYIIDMLTEGHSHEFVTNYDDDCHWKECSCGDIINFEEHSFDEGTIILQPSETAQGQKLFSCFCGKTQIEYLPFVSEAEGELSFHFMLLGNDYAGDCIYVKAQDKDILIDAGSRENSIPSIKNYVDRYMDDNVFEYVIATHGHQDHIAGFAKSNGSIFDLYECEVIIDFPKTNSTSQTYNRYVSERNAEISNGASHFTALECYNQSKEGAKRVYNLTDDGSIRMEILYNYFYDHKTSAENDYSVCVMFYHGTKQFLFTGDLEKEGEEKLAQKYDFSKVQLYKAGHHGSKTSSNECLLREIKPEICVVCCCAGSVEYTQELANTFPTQDFIDRIAPYTAKVYLPTYVDLVYDEAKEKYKNGDMSLLNGEIVVNSGEGEQISVSCSNNDTILKDTDWFKNNRVCPSAWK